jgi:CheY-like chemotaxis protein
VDDQEPAIALFQRYLSRSNVLVVGLTQAGQALELAQHLQPVLIALDVMMPQVDGWEVLQALKLNKDTSNIPVLVCSAWQEPELAISLGAAGFLKKPITQKQFLDALHLMDII